MDYNTLKKLDEESSKKLEEGSGPADECICHLFTSDEAPRGGLGASIKRALGSIGRGPKRTGVGVGKGKGSCCVTLPLTSGPGITTTKRVVQRRGSCGKCGCDSEKFVLKDSDVSIRITTPDISTICPCPTDCLPDKAKLKDNIRVTIEYTKTPEPATSWVNKKFTKEQASSTHGQTRAIREKKKQNYEEDSSKEDQEDSKEKEDYKDKEDAKSKIEMKDDIVVLKENDNDVKSTVDEESVFQPNARMEAADGGGPARARAAAGAARELPQASPITTTKRAVQRRGSCGKCGCDSEQFVLKDSDVNIRITTPDISTICPCPTDCLPDKAKFKDNIRVTIEYTKTPEPATSWVNKTFTKEQASSTHGQTRAIKEKKKQNYEEDSSKEDQEDSKEKEDYKEKEDAKEKEEAKSKIQIKDDIVVLKENDNDVKSSVDEESVFQVQVKL